MISSGTGHLPANAITSLSAFVSSIEGYTGLWPTKELWIRFFGLRRNVVPNIHVESEDKQLTQFGAASISPRRYSIFPRVTGLDSCKGWARTFFYVRNEGTEDLIRLLPYAPGPPNTDFWEEVAKKPTALANQVNKRFAELKKLGLRNEDAMITFMRNRISPLQRRTHKLCHMSFSRDPNRTSSFELSNTEIFRRVKALFTTHKDFSAEWTWGIEHYCRDRLPPAVSFAG